MARLARQAAEKQLQETYSPLSLSPQAFPSLVSFALSSAPLPPPPPPSLLSSLFLLFFLSPFFFLCSTTVRVGARSTREESRQRDLSYLMTQLDCLRRQAERAEF